jgi:hypothetical protein
MLNRSKLATVAALAASIAWLALPAEAKSQPRYRGVAAFGYLGAEQNWRYRGFPVCSYIYIGGPKGVWACR